MSGLGKNDPGAILVHQGGKKEPDSGRTGFRSPNLLIRSQAPYPLGHTPVIVDDQ